MKYYAVIKDENIIEVAVMPQPWANPQEVKLAHPTARVAEISQDDYELVKYDMTIFKHNGKKVMAKSKTERDAIEQHRKDWAKHNTLEGLREQIEELKKSNYK